MNRSELIGAISDRAGLTRKEADAVLEALVYEITKSVRSGDDVRVTGFGTFKLRNRKARTGRNPQTGEAVRIKASKGIAFSPGATLKADLNSKRK
jgi:nucleoid DNA-binding protein